MELPGGLVDPCKRERGVRSGTVRVERCRIEAQPARRDLGRQGRLQALAGHLARVRYERQVGGALRRAGILKCRRARLAARKSDLTGDGVIHLGFLDECRSDRRSRARGARQQPEPQTGFCGESERQRLHRQDRFREHARTIAK